MMVREETLTAGMVKKEVKLEFSSDWDNMTKNAVFSAGEVSRAVTGVSDVAVIPAEVLAEPLKQLYVGVYGVSLDGKVTPTIRVRGPLIQPGTDPACDKGTDPDLPVWAQLQLQIDDLKENDAEGGYYIPSVTQPEADVLQIAFTPSTENLPEVETVIIDLPGSDSDQDIYVLPVAGEALGGVKNGGNVVINADGTMTAPTASSGGEALPDYVNQEIDVVLRKIRAKFAELRNPIIIGMHTDQHTTALNLSSTNTQLATDVYHGMKALVEISKNIPFNVICLGGDASGGSEETSQAGVNYVNGCFADAPCQVAHLCGNHDTFHDFQFDSADDIFASHFKLWIKKGYITQPDGYEGTCVGYYDDPTCKVRFVYGDTNSHVDWSPQQNNTAISVMLDGMPDGYRAVIFTHHPFTGAEPDKVICCINGHTHISDAYIGDDGVVHISTATAGGTVRDDLPRPAGTADGTAFDVYVIDPDNNIAYIYRYGVGDDRVIDLAGGEVVTYHNVTVELITATADVANGTVAAGSAFTANITTTEKTKAIIVTMGGVDVTADVYADGVVRIESVTGDIVITDTSNASGEGGGESGGSSSAELPDGYTALEYIVNDGGAAIQLTDISGGDTSAIYKVNHSAWDTTSTNILNDDENYTFPCIFLRSTGAPRFWPNNCGNKSAVNGVSVSLALNTDYVIQAFGPNGEIYVDGVAAASLAKGTATEFTKGFVIGATPEYGSNGDFKGWNTNAWKGRLYYLKMYESGVQTRNFIPAQNADGNVGLYDTIQGEFYDSDSNVVFTAPA